MLDKKRGAVLVISALLAVMAIAPMAGASTFHTVVNPKAGTANVTAYVNTTATIKTNSSLVQILDLFAHNSTDNLSLSQSNQMFVNFQNAISNKSDAKIQSLYIQASTNFDKMGNQTLGITHSMKIMMNLTNVFQNGSANMSWRYFNDSSPITINHTSYSSFNLGDNSLTTYSALNFTAFHKPLNQWKRNYDAATNVTTFSMDAGTTLNYTSNTTVNSSLLGGAYYFNVTVKSDPSSTIVTPGNAQATGNSITYGNAPSTPTGLMKYLPYVVVVVVIGIGLGVNAAARRRRN